MKTSTVLIINEPFVDDFCRTQRWAARTRARVLRAPDWLAYATSVLEKDGVETELYDFPAKHWNKDKLVSLVSSKKPCVVVLDSTTPSIYSDIHCARLVKEASPDTLTLMVGPHASALPRQTLREAETYLDAVAVGEYEYTVREFIRNHKNRNSWNQINGLVFRDDGGNIRINPGRPLIEDLDELPFPAWHHLNLWDYFDGGKLYPYVTLIGGRGCPFKCIFCLWPQVMHGNRFRFRSPENIVAEMEWVLDKWPGVRKGEFFFEDDTFTVNKDRSHKICDLIINRRLKCTWSVNVRADITDNDLLKHMRAAGCRLLLAGFESGSQKMLDTMQKNIKVEKMVAFIRLARKAGLEVHGCFVLGLPGETEDTIRETIDFALSNPLNTLQFSGAVPFPGTRYFDYASRENLLRTRKWDEWLQDGEQAPIVEYPGLSKELIAAFVDQGLKKFYFRPSYMLRFLCATRSRSDFYRKIRGAKNFINYLWDKRRKKRHGAR